MAESKKPIAEAARRLSGRGDTRQALINGALKLLDGDKSFDSLSLRELTRAVGVVPTAFYRHFADMEELGLALVEECFRTLRKILADMRKDTHAGSVPIAAIVKSLIQQVQKHRRHFRFIASERYSGDGLVRQAVRRELRLVQSELATDLARLDVFRRWSVEDLQMAAGVLLNHMVAIADEILEQTRAGERPRKELMTLAEKQLRLVVLGLPHWRSDAAI